MICKGNLRCPPWGRLPGSVVIGLAMASFLVPGPWASVGSAPGQQARLEARRGGTPALAGSAAVERQREGQAPPRFDRELPPLFPQLSTHTPDGRGARRDVHRGSILRTGNGPIDLSRPLPDGLAQDPGRAIGRHGVTVLVLFDQPRSGRELGVFRQAGVRLLAPYGPRGVVAQVSGPESIRIIQGLSGVSNILPFAPELIVDRRIGQTAVLSQEEAKSSTLPLVAGVFPGVSARAVAADLQALGADVQAVETRPGAIPIIHFRLDYDRILGVARSVFGLFRIEEELPFMAADEEMAATIQSGEFFNGRVDLWDAGVDGGGNGLVAPQILAVTDTGLSYDALHFSDTATAAGNPGAAHSKIESYLAVGSGDLFSCDDPASGGSTHGNIVAGIAAGNVSRFGIDLRNNPGWEAAKTPFAADGVARGARVVFQDAQSQVGCLGSFDIVQPGNLFDRMTEAKGAGASIHNMSFSALGTEGAYTLDSMNVDQFLRDNNDYLAVIAVGNEGSDADGDGNFEYGSITAPATGKNALGVGSSNYPNEPINAFDLILALNPGVPNEGVNLLAIFTDGSTGRGPASFPSRVKPDVMAPGQDLFPNLRVDGAATCRSSDNDNIETTGGVECLLDDDNDGTSYSAAAVSGAAALVRDYFAQGFLDDGAAGGPTVGMSLSGAAVKAALIASAEFMQVSPAFNFDLVQPRFDIPDLRGRFNFEQGYGRVNLSKILPLNTDPRTPSGLLMEDQGLSGGLLSGGIFTRLITVLDPDEELRVALAWMDPPDMSLSGALINDLDLEVVDHGPDNILGTSDDVLYRGNFFTEDQGNFDGRLSLFDPNFPSIPGEDSDGDGVLDEGPFSLPVVPSLRNFHDQANPNEAVMLSPDPNQDGDTADTQVFAGRQYTVRVKGVQVTSPFETVISPGANALLDSTPAGDDLVSGSVINAGPDGLADTLAVGDDVQEVAVGQSAPQPFALIIGGGIVTTAAVRLNASRYLCNDLLVPTVLDPSSGLAPADVASVLSLQVMAPGGGGVLDAESDVVLSQPDPGNGRFLGDPLAVIDGVTAVMNDGILSVVDGAQIVATYADADGPTIEAVSRVSCQPRLDLATIAGPGTNQKFNVQGGCDAPRPRDPRGFLIGAQANPRGDLFLDAGERLSYTIAMVNEELNADLIDAVATLRAVIPDGDNATDPLRLNNIPADSGNQQKIQIHNPSRDVGLIPSGTLQAISFDIEVEPDVAFPDQIEMIFGLSARRNGLPVESTAVFLHTLNMDLESFRYSTDFPNGGTEVRTFAGEFFFDPNDPELGAQTFVFEDASSTAFGGGNPQWAAAAPEPKAPWTFDLDNEGFITTRRFDSDPGLNLQLNLNLWHWANTGECGFQSNDPSQIDPDFSDPNNIIRGQGGIWHTGTIGTDPPEAGRKLSNGRTGFDLGCEDYDIPNDASSPTNEQVLDVLQSPVFHRVHVNPDPNGFNYTLEFTRFAFNNQLDIADINAIVGWELDPDTSTPDPVDATDFGWLNLVNSARGFLTGVSQIPFPTFDPNNPAFPGSEFGFGPQGRGSIGSFFDPSDPAKAPARSLAAVGGTGFGTIQLRGAGGLPLRNVEEILDGFYGADTTFEDLFGPNENPLAVPPIRRDDFQVDFGMFVTESSDPLSPTQPSYGIGIDDVVVEWVESHPVPDVTPCASVAPADPTALGSCGRIFWDRSVVFEAEDSAVLTVLDADALFGPDGVAGTGDEQAVDSDGDGFLEVQARVFSDVDLTGEMITLEQTSFLSPIYEGVVQLSGSVGLNSAADGIIFMQQNGDGTVPVVITAQYTDLDDGTGQPCPDNPVKATMTTQFRGANVLFVSAKVTDLTGDLDGLPDDNETIRLDITLVSNLLDSAENPVVLEDTRISLLSTDGDVACITDSEAFYGNLTPGVATVNPPSDAFELVISNVDRQNVFQQIRASLSLGITGTFVDINGRRRVVSSFATPQQFDLKLDLDLAGFVTAAPDFVENWDSTSAGGDGVNSFTLNALFPNSAASAVDGSRCQYNDPAGPNPNGGGRSITFCRPWTGHDWHVHTATEGPEGKAFSGNAALLMGFHEPGASASFDTYTTAQLSAAMTPVLNVGLSGGATVSFRQIVSLADDRVIAVDPGQALDRAVVQVALADPLTGDVTDFWETLAAFQNNYANQGTDAFINCKYDPVDDFYDTFAAIPDADPFQLQNSDGASTEDDYFDPNDPDRRLGPSSTCFPEFVFSFMGDWSSTDPRNSGSAFVQGSPGALGNGIWVESRFNLDQFAGQSIRVRLLFSGIELNGPSGNRWAQFFGSSAGDTVRGWIVDDFRVTGLVDAPAELAVDAKMPPMPSCPVDPDPTTPANEAACTTAIADAGPDIEIPAPGFLATLDGSPSTVDSCVNGFIEYRWRQDKRVVQDWSNQFIFRDNPAFSTAYFLDVRCSVDPECADTTRIQVTVGGNLREISQGGSNSPLLTVVRSPQRILTGPNGIADSLADPTSDDVQTTAVGVAGVVAVDAGPDGLIQSLVGGDDILDDFRITLTWETLGSGLGYDLQKIDIAGGDPVPLRNDPLATPLATLPGSRLCRLAQTGEGVGTFVEDALDPAPGQVFGFLANLRRTSDGVPGNLGAGLATGGGRPARPEPPTTSCP
ncbi:MAG: S8 family serine peptidase [Acidobacteriota bacterium]